MFQACLSVRSRGPYVIGVVLIKLAHLDTPPALGTPKWFTSGIWKSVLCFNTFQRFNNHWWICCAPWMCGGIWKKWRNMGFGSSLCPNPQGSMTKENPGSAPDYQVYLVKFIFRACSTGRHDLNVKSFANQITITKCILSRSNSLFTLQGNVGIWMEWYCHNSKQRSLVPVPVSDQFVHFHSIDGS